MVVVERQTPLGYVFVVKRLCSTEFMQIHIWLNGEKIYVSFQGSCCNRDVLYREVWLYLWWRSFSRCMATFTSCEACLNYNPSKINTFKCLNYPNNPSRKQAKRIIFMSMQCLAHYLSYLFESIDGELEIIQNNCPFRWPSLSYNLIYYCSLMSCLVSFCRV